MEGYHMALSNHFYTITYSIRPKGGCFPASRNGYAFCGILMLISEIWKQWTLTFTINHGTYSWWHFPFQLCSIPMYVCLAIGFLSSARIRKHIPFLQTRADRLCSLLKAFLMDFGMLGGIFVFFDTSGMHYGYLPLTLHSYIWHILLIILGCVSGLSSNSCHSWKGWQFSVTLYLVCCTAATIFNLTFHRYGIINMFYISPHYYMHQKVFCHITDALGNGCGIAAYITSSIIGAGLFHLMWNKINRLRIQKETPNKFQKL